MHQKSQIEPSQVQAEPRSQITTVQRKTSKLLRIHADDYSTKHLVIFWVLYIALVIGISLLTLALPPTFVTISNADTVFETALHGCPNPIGFDANGFLFCNPISQTDPTAGLLMRGMSPNNQFMLVYLNFILQNKAEPVLQLKNQAITLQFYKLEEQRTDVGINFKKVEQLQNQEANFSMSSYESQRIWQDNGYSFKGYKKFFGYKKYVQEKHSLVLFKFKKWPLPNVKEISMEVSTVSPPFTIFAIVLRYIFFAISLGTTVGYYFRYKLIPQSLKTLQMKAIMFLSIFTVMFNDPLYAATILAPNGFTAFVSVAFVVNFLTFLMAFWMVFIDRILYESGEKFENAINRRKIVYFVLFYVSLFVLQFMAALHRFSDMPIIAGYQIQSGAVVAFQVISFLIFAIGLIYIAVQYVRCVMNFFNKIWRNQMFLMFSLIFIIVIVVMLIIDGFSVYEYTGNRILVLYSFMNMYTIYLQYMWTITKKQAQKLQRDLMLGTGDHGEHNEVQTMVSNFGNQQIMVDLDSQQQGSYYGQSNNPNRVNKYSHNIDERLNSKDQHQLEQEDTKNNLKQGKEKMGTFDIQD